MTRAIANTLKETGMAVGFKPGRGILREQSLEWLSLMKEELGDAWLPPHLFVLAPVVCSRILSGNSNFTSPAGFRRNIASARVI